MRCLVLLVVLVAPVAFAGSLSGTHASKLTLRAEPEFVPTPMPSSSVNLTSATVRLIDHQLQLLDFQKSSLVGPVFTLAVGGAMVLTGAVMMLVGINLAGAVALIGFTVLVGAALPLAIGITWLVVNLGFNERIAGAMEKLRDERKSLMLEVAVF